MTTPSSRSSRHASASSSKSRDEAAESVPSDESQDFQDADTVQHSSSDGAGLGLEKLNGENDLQNGKERAGRSSTELQRQWTDERKSGSASAKRSSSVRSSSNALSRQEQTAAKTPRASTLSRSDKTPLSPSHGALSLLDPSEMIVNPFSEEEAQSAEAAESASSLPEPAEAVQQQASTSTEEHEQRANEMMGEEIDLDSPNRTPSVPFEQRFSNVSLGNTPNASPRVGASQLPEEEPRADGSSEFVTRHASRLSSEDGSKRNNARAPSDRMQERFNEIREEADPKTRRSSLRRSRRMEKKMADDDESADKSTAAGDGGSGTSQEASESHDKTNSPTISEETSYNIENGEAIDWDFWGRVMSDYGTIARSEPHKLSRAIQTGIPSALRGMLWQLMSSSKDEEMEIIYAYYLKQSSPHEKMIRKDLARTFPGQDYFQDGKGIGQENLFNVMKAYSLYDEEVGYCQGMQFVVGPLLLNMPDEEAFSTLVRLMKSYDLRGHFVPNMPALQLRLFQFERLLEEFLPLLHRHLVRAGVKTSMFASGWLMTLFCYRSPLLICYRILDSVFAEGIEALFRFALALMQKNEEQLLNMEFDEAVPLLAAKVFEVYRLDESCINYDAENVSTDSALRGAEGAPAGHANSEEAQYNVDALVRDAFEFKITPFMLDSYAADFAEQVRHATAHRREVEDLKIENRILQNRVKSLEDQLSAVQSEHVDLVKSVVTSKLAEEEMAEELMKYKMMYAEAALLVDQSGISGNGLTNISLNEDSSSHSRLSNPSSSLHLSRESSHSQHSWR